MHAQPCYSVTGLGTLELVNVAVRLQAANCMARAHHKQRHELWSMQHFHVFANSNAVHVHKLVSADMNQFDC